MKREMALGVLVLGGALVMSCAGTEEAEPEAPPAESQAAPPADAPPENVVEVERLEDNLFVLRGGGGNSAAFITSDGVVLVDTKLAGWGQPLIDAVGELTSNPITTIINTHAHFDHVDGNVEFPATVEFVAHENTQRLMRENNAVRGLGTEPRSSPFDGDDANGIPEQTFTDTLTLGSDADRVELHYFGRAHTSGDTWVEFPSLRTVHAGDAFPNKMVPIMDSNNGGSGVDYPETLRNASAGLTEIDQVITGHGPVMTPADLSDYAEFVAGFVSDAQAAESGGHVGRRLHRRLGAVGQLCRLHQRPGRTADVLRAGHLRRDPVTAGAHIIYRSGESSTLSRSDPTPQPEEAEWLTVSVGARFSWAHCWSCQPVARLRRPVSCFRTPTTSAALVIEYEDDAIQVVAAYNYSQRNHESRWLLIEIGVATQDPMRIRNGDITLVTPDDRVIHVASQRVFSQDFQRTRLIRRNASPTRHLDGRIGNYFRGRPGQRFQWFVVTAFEGTVTEFFDVDFRRTAWGDLYFASPTGAWDEGTYSLVVEGRDETRAVLPIDLD